MDIRIKHRTLVLSAAIMALVFATGPAQYNLGVGYAKGQGVCKDYVQAHKWVNLAASRTTPEEMGGSRSLVRDSLAEKMTASQVAESQRVAREWEPKTWKQLKPE